GALAESLGVPREREERVVAHHAPPRTEPRRLCRGPGRALLGVDEQVEDERAAAELRGPNVRAVVGVERMPCAGEPEAAHRLRSFRIDEGPDTCGPVLLLEGERRGPLVHLDLDVVGDGDGVFEDGSHRTPPRRRAPRPCRSGALRYMGRSTVSPS